MCIKRSISGWEQSPNPVVRFFCSCMANALKDKLTIMSSCCCDAREVAGGESWTT